MKCFNELTHGKFAIGKQKKTDIKFCNKLIHERSTLGNQ